MRFSLTALFEWTAVAGTALGFWISLGTAFVVLTLPLLAVLLAATTGRRSGRSRAGTAVVVFFVTLMLGGAAVFLHFLATFTWFDYQHEYKDLTYRQFAAEFDTSYFDPKGASHIYRYIDKYIDGYDEVWKITIPPHSYEALLSDVSGKLKAPDDPSFRGEGLGPVRKTTATGAEIPATWRSPSSPPSWWQPQKAGPNTQCTRWELQVRKEDMRARGWYWVYDRDLETLWNWEWNHQWQDLGW